MNMKKLAIKLARIPFDLILRAVFIFPVLPILYCLEPFRKIRLGLMYTQRIGHLVGNTELFIRGRQINGVDPKEICILAGWDPANRQLFKMYKRLLPIYESRWLTRIMFSWYPLLSRTRFFEPLNWSNQDYTKFNSGRATLTFTEEEEALGRANLRAMGIGENDWFVCLHIRDSAYLNAWRPQYSDLWKTRDFRNCSIENYFDAMDYVTRMGGYVVRMGSVVEAPLANLENPKIIDYATLHRDDFMDIYLPARCRLFIGSDSGLYSVATAFDVPLALANNIFLRAGPFRKDDIFIPKLVIETETGKCLSFREALDLGFLDDSRQPPISEKITYRENQPGEIVDLVREAFTRLSGGGTDPEGDRLSEVYRQDITSDLPGYEYAGRLGGAFAVKYRHLIEAGADA
jgi:putative glycosyltransferase (TIGR04372 family)